MDSREVRNLMEAYLDVYANEMHNLYEKIATPPNRFNLRKGLTPEQRRLRRSGDFYVYGNDSDPEGRRISTSKGEGGITKNPKKLRKQKSIGELPEDFELWVDALLDEGYDLSDYTWDEVYEAYTELLEANSGYNMDKINKDPLAAMTPATFLKAKDPGQQFASPRRKGPGGGRIPSSLAPSRTAANVADIIKGEERNISRSRSLPKEPKTTKMVKKDGKWVKEAFDIVLAHLVNEGYANDFDSARSIMVNMSEEWIHSIVENN